MRRVLAMFPLAACLAWAGCSSPPTAPGEAISAADYALRKAEEDGAAEHAPLVLKEATDKLARARTAREATDHRKAGRLAKEATLEAQLADSMVRNAQAKADLERMQRTVGGLKEELDRGVQ